MVDGDSWASLEKVGKAALRLHEANNWIARRVETVKLIDTSQVDRTVSLEIDLDAVASAAVGAGLPVDGSVKIPLALLPKNLLLDLDVRDAGGRACSLVLSEDDSTVAQATILAKLQSLDVKVSDFSQDILDNIYRIAITMPSPIDIHQIYQPRGQVPMWRLSPGTRTDMELWEDLFEIPSFVELVTTFTLNYTPMIELPLGTGLYLVKYRHLERQTPPHPPRRRFGITWERYLLSLDSFQQVLEAPAVGRCSREHLRFEAPEGLFIEEFYLRLQPPSGPAATDPNVSTLPRPTTGTRESTIAQSRVTPERGVIYTRDMPVLSQPYVAVALLRPRVAGFLRTSQYTVFLTALLLLIGAAVQFWDNRLSESGTSSEAAVTLLLVVPSIMSAFLAREGEHELLSDLLRRPRIAVALSAVAALFAGGAMVTHVTSWRLGVWWTCAAVVGFAVFTLLRRIASLSSEALAQTESYSGRTFSELR